MARARALHNRRKIEGFVFYNPGRRRSDPETPQDGVSLISLFLLCFVTVVVPVLSVLASMLIAGTDLSKIPGMATMAGFFRR